MRERDVCLFRCDGVFGSRTMWCRCRYPSFLERVIVILLHRNASEEVRSSLGYCYVKVLEPVVDSISQLRARMPRWS